MSDWLKRDDGFMRLSYRAGTDPSDSEIDAIKVGLNAYNSEHTENPPIVPVGCVARDEAGRIVAGAHGNITWGWLYIERLWVDESLRGKGIGTEVLARLERTALGQGVHRFHVGTTSFQALDFYRKQGYEIYATLEDMPPGHTDYALKKIIELTP